jgi:ATP-dependent DNA helicase RecG
LEALRCPVAELPGIASAMHRMLARLLATPSPRVIDLLALAPTGIVDPTPLDRLLAEHHGRAVTLDCRIGPHRAPARSGPPWRIAATAAGSPVDLVLFNVRGDWPLRRYPEGSVMRLHGRIASREGRWQLPHPEPLETGTTGPLPLYPLTAGLGQARLRRIIGAALASLRDMPEWQDYALLRRERWPGWREALACLHSPATGIDPQRPERRRLAYDELLASQLALGLVRRSRERAGGRPIRAAGHLRAQLLHTLPFSLTPAQLEATAEILGDMATPGPMLRLLMGDVGSGKTLVALLAMLEAIEAGCQAALMVPTEVLARQHAATLKGLLAPLGLAVERLTGKETPASRRGVLARLRSGEARLVVGTHALFQAGVDYADLGLAVIDEQHRFGVHQRLGLRAKGHAVDMLLLTATPIPRTLLMSAYGDIATSRLAEKPPGRQRIGTSTVPVDRMDEVVAALARALNRGERAYWICPLVEESAESELAAAQARAEMLRQVFGSLVGLVHGRLRAREKAQAMRAFAAGETRLLIATTVIEVGIDVPEASIIVIEAAERFGLAQLHQLRGRVGRGARPSHCLLLFTPPLSAVARQRLKVLRDTDDGFRIAEEDLRLRGPGEMLGVRQSGLPGFRFADLALDQDLLAVAHDDARLVLARDPALSGERGQALRLLLQLFERDEATALLAAG